MDARDVLIEAAGRPAEAARALRGSLARGALNVHPANHPNSPAWLLWHSGRELDSQLSELTGASEVWTGRAFSERSGLGALGESIGLGHTGEQARAIAVDDPDVLLDYLTAVTEELCAYVRTLREADLDTVIDESWDPPVTRGVRLVSMIDDAVQHVGQAAYAAGAPDPGA
ncbi:mycothiol transferase [Brevibacterium album]|uniref:mycothiol transferase n=1 Tax=Brevibacterium album TaxID=417948 RepID=UPI000407A9F5|nr:DinB family protein [Brevibacterium album]